MAERTFDYEKIADIYKSMKDIAGDAGNADSIAGILDLANKEMEAKCGVEDEAIFGPLGDQLSLDWNNFSSNFPNFVANFNNWATVVSNAAGQYQEFEDAVSGLKNANPLGFASEGREMNYIGDSYYQKYTDENIADFETAVANFKGLYELTGAEYTVSGASSRLATHKKLAIAQIPFYAVGAFCTAVGAYALVSSLTGAGAGAGAGETASAETATSTAEASASTATSTAEASASTATSTASTTETAVSEAIQQTGANVARNSVSTASQLTLEDGTTFVQNSAGRWIDQATGRYVSNAAVEAARQTAATTAEQTVANATRLTLSNGTNIVQNSAGRWIVEAGQSGGGQFVSNAAVEEAKNIAYNQALSGLTGGTTQVAAAAPVAAPAAPVAAPAAAPAPAPAAAPAPAPAPAAAPSAAPAPAAAPSAAPAGSVPVDTVSVSEAVAKGAGEKGGSILSKFVQGQKDLITTAVGKNPDASTLQRLGAQAKLGMEAGGLVYGGATVYGLANKKK